MYNKRCTRWQERQVWKIWLDAFSAGGSLSKDDYVIICGDFGIWDGSKKER
jgi:hypothetical protein